MHFEAKLKQVTDDVDRDNDYWDERKFLNQKSEEVWKYISPKLYTIFWYLSLDDLVVPDESYV